MKKSQKACILGGTGFVGRELIRRLVERGYECHIPTRRAHRHRDLKLYRGVVLHPTPTLDHQTLVERFTGCDLVVNLIGILNESSRSRFQQIHVDLVDHVLRAAHQAGVPRLLHLSALNANRPETGETKLSNYLKSKGAGEALVLATESPQTTVFRPSVIFGRGDSLFTRFAALLDWAPGLFPLACADTRFAPVWVGDLAEAMMRSLNRPESIGQAYDLCGPRSLTLHELLAFTARVRGRKVKIIDLGDRAAQWQARVFEHLPGKPFTMDNFRSLQIDSVCTENNGLQQLDIAPVDIEVEVPAYLSRK